MVKSNLATAAVKPTVNMRLLHLRTPLERYLQVMYDTDGIPDPAGICQTCCATSSRRGLAPRSACCPRRSGAKLKTV